MQPFTSVARNRNPWHLDGIRIDSVSAEAPLRGYGESYTYALALEATDDPETNPTDVVHRFNEIIDRCRFAEAYELFEPDRGRPKYTATSPPGEPSPLVSLVPTSPHSTVRGLWGLIDGLDVGVPPAPETDPSPANAQLDLELTYLASVDEYPDRAAVERELSYPGL